ncbi:hypothetical protein F511_36473 [Dorcoceras hygrometricum]|uniref:Uncharacterized protein n=1 Tax=Dorcoceras hygrometricum TaxID=472368 RepID=A0A2Z7AD15_9LAMI|nr:hypothetical protein F511_36473 [Dorcoceras hygrometricum]
MRNHSRGGAACLGRNLLAIARPAGNPARTHARGGGRSRQSGPRPEVRLLHQPALEALTRSARTDSPRQVGRNNFWRGAAAAARETRRRRRCLKRGGEAATRALRVRVCVKLSCD